MNLILKQSRLTGRFGRYFNRRPEYQPGSALVIFCTVHLTSSCPFN